MEITSIFQVIAICLAFLGWVVMLGLIIWAIAKTHDAKSMYKEKTKHLRDGARRAHPATAEKTTGVIMWGENVPVPFE